MQLIDKENKPRSEASAIMQYFGRHEGQTVSQFNDELKALTAEAKTELAVGAAKELGWTVQN